MHGLPGTRAKSYQGNTISANENGYGDSKKQNLPGRVIENRIIALRAPSKSASSMPMPKRRTNPRFSRDKTIEIRIYTMCRHTVLLIQDHLLGRSW